MNKKQLFTRFIEGMAFSLAIGFQFCAPAEAWQLLPNPNPSGNTISVTVSADNFLGLYSYDTIGN